jgi:N-acetylneuraminate synthase/N,N'-diacetyllegionaminate synthase
LSKVLIIAEAGVNHNGNIELAKKLIDVARDAGADFVKFQTFIAEKNISREDPKARYQDANYGSQDSQLDMVRKYELSKENHLDLIAHCKKRGINFLSTAFDLESIELLEELASPMYKIPSGEIISLPYLKKIASLKKPVILSTGMASLGEIENAINVLIGGGVRRDDIIVLHCNTEYPTPMYDVNLRAMLSIGDAFKVKIGYSDHTLGIEVPIAAVALGAVVIEKHFTLKKTLPGPDHAASLEPAELKAMVKAIRNVELAIGGNGVKEPSQSELKNISVARKSIHIAKDLQAGHILTNDDLIALRPGDGISPMQWDFVVGRQLTRCKKKFDKLSYSDVI